MDIYPEDLDPVYRSRIQQMQKMLSLQEGTYVFGRSFDGCLGALCGMAPSLVFNFWLHIVPDTLPGGVFLAGGAGAAVGYVCGFFVDRHRRSQRRTDNVTAREINLIRQGETDALRLEYFGFLSKLTSMQLSQDLSAEDNIRHGLRDIGAGIEKLPRQPADDLLLNTEMLQQEASRLLLTAAKESDSVVAASLQRQAVAQSQRADAVSRNSELARRNQVLRREMTGHMRTLMTLLSATTLDDSSSSYNFTELVQSIQQVASEAKSLTEAKKELVSALTEEQGVREIFVPQPAQLHNQ